MIGLRLAGQPSVNGVFPDEKLRSDIRKWEESFPGLKFTDLIMQQGEMLTDGRQIEPPDFPAVPQPPEWFRQFSPKQMCFGRRYADRLTRRQVPPPSRPHSKPFWTPIRPKMQGKRRIICRIHRSKLPKTPGHWQRRRDFHLKKSPATGCFRQRRHNCRLRYFSRSGGRSLTMLQPSRPSCSNWPRNDQSGRCSPPAKIFLDTTVLEWPIKNPRMAWSVAPASRDEELEPGKCCGRIGQTAQRAKRSRFSDHAPSRTWEMIGRHIVMQGMATKSGLCRAQWSKPFSPRRWPKINF